jgi:hypothetical protein
VIQLSEVRSCRHFDQFVSVQIHEPDALRPQLRIEPALDQDQLGVPLMSWTFAHHDTSRPELEEASDGQADAFYSELVLTIRSLSPECLPQSRSQALNYSVRCQFRLLLRPQYGI